MYLLKLLLTYKIDISNNRKKSIIKLRQGIQKLLPMKVNLTIKKLKIGFLLTLLLTIDSWAQFSHFDSPFKKRIKAISQDSKGLIWIASNDTVANFDGHQFKQVDLKNIEALGPITITDMEFITDQELLIATLNHGLLSYPINQSAQPKTIVFIPEKTIFSIEKTSQGLWVATKNGLYFLNNSTHKFYQFPEPKRFINKIVNKDNEIIIASFNHLISFDIKHKTFTNLPYPYSDKTQLIFDLHVNQSKSLFISSDQGIYEQNPVTSEWSLNDHNPAQCIGVALTSSDDTLWIGTVTQGLINNASYSKNKHFLTSNSNIASNNVTALYKDQNANLWQGFNDGSISISNPNALALKFNQDQLNESGCKNLNPVFDFSEESNKQLWAATAQGVIKIDHLNRSCITVKLVNESSPYKHKTSIPKLIFTDNKDNLWAYYHNFGLAKINSDDQALLKINHPIDQDEMSFHHFISHTDSNTFILANTKGLFSYSLDRKELTKLKPESKALENSFVSDSFPLNKQKHLLATNQGVAIYDHTGFKIDSDIQNQLPTKRIQNVFKDSASNIWIGTADSGLFRFNQEKKLVKHFDHQSLFTMNEAITNILEDDHKNLWISLESHLIKLNIQTNQINVMDIDDGLNVKTFIKNSSIRLQDGQMYFGANNGFISFYPEQINFNTKPPSVIFTKLTRFNKEVKPQINYDGFQIDQSISTLKQLSLSHKDYVIGFEFAALDYTVSQQNKYAYKLEGFDPDWNYVDANNRKATYTDLPSGQYTFIVKASNKYDIWTEPNTSIDILVNPAPWFSWWAWLSYTSMFIFMVWYYINKKTRDSQKQAALLKLEVNNKTQELNIQKQRVESLLHKKNELFSNVSHEFRTPLTLILNPLKEVIHNGQTAKDINSLQLINRNANRLLSMVEQLLQLARISDTDKVTKNDHQTRSHIHAIVSSFQNMATTKKLKLNLVENQDATIHVTDQCIDAILGNLLSNAIKYTQSGGQVQIAATIEHQMFTLKVQDTGAGLSEEQQKDIFKRFKRLTSHQEIEGIGIGLAVVEEVVKINHGSIEVESEIGIGSEFIVKLPLSESLEPSTPSNNDLSNSSLITQLANQLPSSQNLIEINQTQSNNKLNNILIIEDNYDMRKHIASITQLRYNTMTAKHGKEGVAMAIEHIPDLIICDVMMPEMDGFRVSRIIRSDERTSHIPLILLTALNDRTSRIKGWREHVDAYMTKPFDRDELLTQLESMLTIRDILKKKTGQNLFSSSKGPSKSHVTLPKKDQQFINKLMGLIEKNYTNPMLNLSLLADKMATSERQLQRKLKALTDQNPIDLLREFRLKKASQLLKDGYQVSLIADECGFNSISYFSSCFKAQYGIPPKKYQQTNTN